MSDDPVAFRNRTKAMMDGARAELEAIGRSYISHLAAKLIDTTPGPNLQIADTEYYATGRLRASWTWGEVARNTASRWDGGPVTEHGEDTLAAIEAALVSSRLPAISYLQSDVAYGHIVHEGLGRMPYARPWVKEVAQDAEIHAAAAIAEVRRG